MSDNYIVSVYFLGNDTDNVVQHILDPEYASDMLDDTFGVLNETIHEYGPWASVWVSEAGGAHSSGGPFVSHTFLNSFWLFHLSSQTSCNN